MALGKRIGMQRKTLEKLGLCGLFHDLGKIEVPKQILNKRGKLNDAEFEEIKKDGVIIARTKIYSWNELSIKTIKKCGFIESGKSFMHEYHEDHGGYVDDLIFHKII